MKTDEWLTPPEIIKALGEFDLDPCAPFKRPWDTARKHYTKAENGLIKKWSGRVWCNPPFGKEAALWLSRMAGHNNGIALVPSRTETKMFFNHVWGKASAILFLRSRPHFYYVTGERAKFNSGAPICLIAYGDNNVRALQNSGLGFVVCGISGNRSSTLTCDEVRCPECNTAHADQRSNKQYILTCKKCGSKFIPKSVSKIQSTIVELANA